MTFGRPDGGTEGPKTSGELLLGETQAFSKLFDERGDILTFHGGQYARLVRLPVSPSDFTAAVDGDYAVGIWEDGLAEREDGSQVVRSSLFGHSPLLHRLDHTGQHLLCRAADDVTAEADLDDVPELRGLGFA